MENNQMEIFASLSSLNFSRYVVSNYGNVYNSKTCRKINGYLENGYRRVYIKNDNGKQQLKTVHFLVASIFCVKDNDNLEIDHIDKNRDNNVATNLRWVTRSDNNKNRNFTTHKGRPVCQIDLYGNIVKK